MCCDSSTRYICSPTIRCHGRQFHCVPRCDRVPRCNSIVWRSRQARVKCSRSKDVGVRFDLRVRYATRALPASVGRAGLLVAVPIESTPASTSLPSYLQVLARRSVIESTCPLHLLTSESTINLLIRLTSQLPAGSACRSATESPHYTSLN
jgi:hypothetical protein